MSNLVVLINCATFHLDMNLNQSIQIVPIQDQLSVYSILSILKLDAEDKIKCCNQFPPHTNQFPPSTNQFPSHINQFPSHTNQFTTNRFCYISALDVVKEIMSTFTMVKRRVYEEVNEPVNFDYANFTVTLPRKTCVSYEYSTTYESKTRQMYHIKFRVGYNELGRVYYSKLDNCSNFTQDSKYDFIPTGSGLLNINKQGKPHFTLDYTFQYLNNI